VQNSRKKVSNPACPRQKNDGPFLRVEENPKQSKVILNQ